MFPVPLYGRIHFKVRAGRCMDSVSYFNELLRNIPLYSCNHTFLLSAKDEKKYQLLTVRHLTNETDAIGGISLPIEIVQFL